VGIGRSWNEKASEIRKLEEVSSIASMASCVVEKARMCGTAQRGEEGALPPIELTGLGFDRR
jgi:hypothetical protein